MANGYFERGEIYWVRVDSGFGSEQGVGRPGVILTNDRANTSLDVVVVAWLTTQQKDTSFNVLTFATSKRSFILCNQIATVDKTRIGKCIGVLPSDEMKKVEDILEDYLDLGYVDDTALKEKETEIAALEAEKADLRIEIAALKAKLESKDDDKLSREIEIAMWKKMYEKALNMVVDMKMGFDVARVQEKAQPKVSVPEPKKPEAPKKVEEPKEPEVTKVDVNSCTFTELKKCGLNADIVLSIIDRRPYKTLEDVKKVPGITNVMWAILVHKICVVPVKKQEEPEKPEKPEVPKTARGLKWDGVKVNINKVETAKELHERTGLNIKACMEIVKHRDQFGAYEKVEDLTNLKLFGNTSMKRYGHMLEV